MKIGSIYDLKLITQPKEMQIIARFTGTSRIQDREIFNFDMNTKFNSYVFGVDKCMIKYAQEVLSGEENR